MASWAQVRTQARQLEGQVFLRPTYPGLVLDGLNFSQTETLLPQYGQFATLADIPTTPTEQERSLEQQLDDILDRRTTIIRQLPDHKNASDASEKQKRSGYYKLHEQKLNDNRSRFSNQRSQIHQKRQHAQLMKGVHRDAMNYRAADPATAESEYMLQERGRIDRSNQGADDLLARAYAVNEGMGLQREQLERIRRKALDVAGMVPGVNGLIGKISSKRRRDGAILGSFIALCFLVMFFLS